MIDLGRSTDSSRTGSRDLLEVMMDKKEEEHHRNGEPRLTTLLVRNNFDLGKPVSFCRRSPNLSRQSLASDQLESDAGRQPCLSAFIHSLGLLSVSSLILAVLSFVVMSIFINMQSPPYCNQSRQSENSEEEAPSLPRKGHLNTSQTDMDNALIKAGFALSSFVLSTCLCCLMVCSMQCFFTSKILKTVEGDERAHKFIRECSSSRVLAVTGFFFSIPVFFVDIIVLLMLRVTYSQAVVAGVILGLGVLFCVLSVMQNCYHWRVEKSRADEGLPVYDSIYWGFLLAGKQEEQTRKPSIMLSCILDIAEH